MDDRIAGDLHAAASQPRIPDDEAAEQIEHRGNRRRRLRRGSLSGASLIVVVAVVLVWPGLFGDTVLMTSPRGQTQTEFALPPPGQAQAVDHQDGTPLFVVHTEEGEVNVLSAVSPHLDHLIVWCPQEQIFVEPVGASVFDSGGTWRGGPAPHGLASYPYEVLEQNGETVVRVADDLQQPSQRPDDTEIPAQASTCFDRTVVGAADDIAAADDEFMLPTPFTAPAPALTVDELRSVPPDEVVVVEATLDLNDTAELCSADRSDCGGTDDAIPVESSWWDPHGPLADYEGATTGTFLVRVADTGVQDLAQLRRDTARPEDIYLHDLSSRDG